MLTAMSGQEKEQGIGVDSDIKRYNEMHDDSKVDVNGRNSSYADLVNTYYNLATDFYEWVRDASPRAEPLWLAGRVVS